MCAGAHATPISRHLSPSATQQEYSYTSNPQDAMDQHESKVGFEGNSLMATESAYASDFLQIAVSRNPLQMSVSKVNAALSTLKQLVSMQDNQPVSAKEFPLPKRSRLSDCDLRELTMPPMNVVIPLLRKARGMPCMVWCGVVEIG